jgi:hypothetical protein
MRFPPCPPNYFFVCDRPIASRVRATFALEKTSSLSINAGIGAENWPSASSSCTSSDSFAFVRA